MLTANETRISYLVILLQNAVNYRNNLLYAEPVLGVCRSFIMMIVLIIMFMFLFHPCYCLKQFKTIQFMIVVSVMLPEVLHQQLGVVQTVDIHVVLLHLSLDVPGKARLVNISGTDGQFVSSLSLPVEVDVDVLMFRLVSPSLSWSRRLLRSWSSSMSWSGS